MEDTEKYLNSILEKRLGSVPNYGGFSKNANTVTRLPKQQQKLQAMPTVFRNKHQSTFRATGVYPGAQQSKNPLFTSQKTVEQLPLKKQDSGGQNERVEYVAISKRLDTKKQEYTAPTVDISKYRKTNYVPPQSINHDPNQFRSQKIDSKNHIRTQSNYLQQNQSHSFNRFQQYSHIMAQDQIAKQQTNKPTVVQANRMTQFSQVSQGGRRRKIFGMSQQKSRPQ